ncbi:MAG: hypothetical protein QOD13_3747 [Thermoleophilaceae bacterium]|nr:hypothetical protein [Thermoleophilaceae bacterium]
MTSTVGIGEPYRPWSAGQPATRRHRGCAARWHARTGWPVFCENARAERANIKATTESSREERANITATTETAGAEGANIAATTETAGAERANITATTERSRPERANITATTETAGHSEPERKRWGRVVAYVRDPFGTLVEPASPTD